MIRLGDTQFKVGYRYVECAKHGAYDPDADHCPECGPQKPRYRVVSVDRQSGTYTLEAL